MILSLSGREGFKKKGDVDSKCPREEKFVINVIYFVIREFRYGHICVSNYNSLNDADYFEICFSLFFFLFSSQKQ